MRERAVRMVLEQEREYDSQWSAIVSIASKIGCSAETFRKWLRQTEIDLADRIPRINYCCEASELR